MFGFGFWELVVIVIAAILLIKPEDLPGFFRKLGRIYRQIRDFNRGITRMLHQVETAVKDSYAAIVEEQQESAGTGKQEIKSSEEEEK